MTGRRMLLLVEEEHGSDVDLDCAASCWPDLLRLFDRSHGKYAPTIETAQQAKRFHVARTVRLHTVIQAITKGERLCGENTSSISSLPDAYF